MSLFSGLRKGATAALPVEGHLPGFDGATEIAQFGVADDSGLRGKVVLVNFWTYTCINWLRQGDRMSARGRRSPGTRDSS